MPWQDIALERAGLAGEWRNTNSAVVESNKEIEGVWMNGVDILALPDDGRIAHFEVMVRSLMAVDLPGRLMAKQLAQSMSILN